MTAELMPDRPHPWRRRLLLGGWLVAAVVICVRAGQVQGLQATEWRALAEDQHQSDLAIVAPRGRILARDDLPMAVSRERYSVAIATDQIKDADLVRDKLVEVLGLSRAKAAGYVDPSRRWRPVPGRYPPTAREALRGIDGIHLSRELERYHPHGDLARGVLGRVLDDEGRGGIEQVFEELLRGHPGREVFARDNLGHEIPGERLVLERPEAGGDIVLTLDMDLQEIARQALAEAIETTEARGGDVLVTDPQTGEILALVSVQDGQTVALTAINTPYEPGSTLKPFTVAGLLEHGFASLYDTVDVEDGTWTINQRVLHDVKAEGRMSVADALRVSSNVGVAKAALAMPAGLQYENLRDFGFGTLTGIEVPEVAGTLRRPDEWSAQSPQSLAIGYEVAVTPLQMAMAYGALANGGRLMKPRLVRETRAADGTIERYEPQVVRQVVSPEVARSVGRVLVDVVEDGTGTSARLGTFRVAGKSGTTRRYEPGVGYERGAYWSSFVGFFPAEDPQLVVFVKLDRPKGTYYGGAIAAPVTKSTMEAALAARATPLDRGALLRSVRAQAAEPPATVAQFASQPIDPPAPPADVARDDAVSEGPVGAVPVPDVAGLPSRVAVRRLHALGLRVSIAKPGDILGSQPAAGTRVLPGDTIQLRVRRRSDG